jgi:hypothetical protein
MTDCGCEPAALAERHLPDSSFSPANLGLARSGQARDTCLGQPSGQSGNPQLVAEAPPEASSAFIADRRRSMSESLHVSILPTWGYLVRTTRLCVNRLHQ